MGKSAGAVQPEPKNMSLETVRNLWWIGAMLAASAGALCAYFANLTGQKITDRNTLLAVVPSLSVSYFGENPKVKVKNTSPYPITEVKFYATAYTFGLLGSADSVMGRNAPSGPFKQVASLGPQDEVEIAESQLYLPFFPENLAKYNRAWALTIAFSRASDGKRFVQIEPYVIAPIEGKAGFILILLKRAGGGGVHGAKFTDILQAIDKSEKYYYGPDSF